MVGGGGGGGGGVVVLTAAYSLCEELNVTRWGGAQMPGVGLLPHHQRNHPDEDNHPQYTEMESSLSLFPLPYSLSLSLSLSLGRERARELRVQVIGVTLPHFNDLTKATRMDEKIRFGLKVPISCGELGYMTHMVGHISGKLTQSDVSTGIAGGHLVLLRQHRGTCGYTFSPASS